MGTPVQISPSEYLSTQFGEREPEYAHGEIVERSLPNSEHAYLIMRLIKQLPPRGKSDNLVSYVDLRVRIEEDVYRIPDIAVYEGRQTMLVPDTPPHIVIEILSPGDRMAELFERLSEYQFWGVPNIWLVNPGQGTLMSYRDGTLGTVEVLKSSAYPIEIRYSELID